MRKWKILLVVMMSIMSAEAFCCDCNSKTKNHDTSLTSSCDCGCSGAEKKAHNCH